MNEENRESLTDDQVSALLKKWVVTAPADLESRVMRARADLSASDKALSWWRYLLKGYIRVPVPVACCLVILMIVMAWTSTRMAVACVAQNSRSVACAANAKC